jgi:hypothetical protein
VDAAVGAEVMAAREKVSPPTTLSTPPALRASSSLALMAGSRPLRGT